jgi:chromosome segregation ATPase
VVGINIARAGRVVSYALPATSILSKLEDLRSGKLAPRPAANPRLAELDKQLEGLRKSEQDLLGRTEQLRSALEKTLAGLEEAKKSAAAAAEALKKAEAEANSAHQALQSVEADLTASREQIRKLVDEKSSLNGGQ